MSAANRAISSAGAAVLVAVAAFSGTVALYVATGLVMLLFAYGWPNLLDLPSKWGARVVLALTALGTLTVSLTLGPGISALPFVVVVGVVMAFVSEMLRRDGRLRLVESLVAVVGGVVIVTSAGGWLATAQDANGTALVVAAAACLGAASAVGGALPWRGWLNVVLTVVVAVGAGAAFSAALPDLTVAHGAWAGFVAGILVAALFVLFDQIPELDRPIDALAAAMVPVLIGGMLIYIVAAIINPSVSVLTALN